MVRIQGLDLLRGVAILLVMLRHSWPTWFGGGGIVGVVIFFTLSGYLITGLLTNDIRRFGKVRYGRFYRNRALRLIPALLFLLAGYVVIEGVLRLTGDPAEIPRTVLVAITYTANLPGFHHGSPHLSHLWTLANEEQFYLVWPLLLLLGIKFRKLRLLVALAAGGVFLALVGGLVWAGADTYKIYTLPVAWTIAMVIGAAAKLGEPTIRGFLLGHRRTVSVLLAVLVLGGLTFLPEAKELPAMYLIGGPAIGLATVALIFPLSELVTVHRMARWLVWLGTISYAAYLWNYPIRWWTIETGFGEWFAPATIVLTVATATASWFAVELPANRLKRRLDTKKAPSQPKLGGDILSTGSTNPVAAVNPRPHELGQNHDGT